MNTQSDKLSVMEKVGYSLGDLAANLVFQTLVTYIVFFYTDVYKLGAGAAQTVIFWCGILGGVVFAPIMGMIADRTHTRWGKYRPWVLWTAVPFAIMIFLTFTTPDLGPTGKVIYAFVTYLLLVMLYTANNLPYASLSGVLTGNMAERNSLSSYRFVAVMAAQFIIQVLMLPIILMVGKGDQALGFRMIMSVFAVAGVICFIVTFFTTRERVVVAQEESKISDDLRDLMKNFPWVIMLGVVILVFITLALKGGMYIYYFNNYVDEAALAQFLTNIGFYSFIDWLTVVFHSMGLNFEWPREATASGYGLFNGGGIILMIVGIGFSKSLADKFGKRNIYRLFLAISTLFILAFIAFPKDAIGMMFISQILHGFFYGITIPLMWAMIADVADYSEWKNKRRATGMIFSASILGLKGGLTLGSTIASMILEHYHYNPDLDVQAEETVQGIRLAISLYASIPFFLAAAILFLYEINKRMETQIENDLAERRTATL
ncbi:MFS transporter [Teredinibacter turnerae]|uniref:Sugar transporter n=1 Tax=Teredinibacter turnerae (strain ATCC 39867 / T7901) TaxID=377629 RepID=C5BSM5_TERTT|nr:glycoside-pentoside-hexuronide (GPH):cation symporter [Teredinibacter turnerae]ACR10871.1 sugar transporter [Teredinibacter turnerae T7901]